MRTTAGLLAAAVLAGGCAQAPLTYERFVHQTQGLSDAQVCQAWFHARQTNQADYLRMAYSEASRRGLEYSGCLAMQEEQQKREQEQTKTARNILLGVAIVALTVAAARRGSGGGYSERADTSYSWDLFYNEYRQLVWACRGEQTGQFADQEKCAYKPRHDGRWPSLEAPR